MGGMGKRGAWVGGATGVVGALLAGACASVVGIGDIVGVDAGPTIGAATGSTASGSSTRSNGSGSSGAATGSSGTAPGASSDSSSASGETSPSTGSDGSNASASSGPAQPGSSSSSSFSAVVSMQSCAPGGAGMTNCGSASESCCTTIEVPGGTYYRTYGSGADGGPTDEADPATVSSFSLDKYLVTVGRFRQFVNAWNGGTGFLPAAGAGKHTHLNGGNGLVNSATELRDGGVVSYETGWVAADWNNAADVEPTTAELSAGCPASFATWTNTPDGQENLPINCVNWYEAYAFCIWDGGFLPSEAEWEYVSAGGSQQREYPWGSAFPGTQYAIYNCEYPSGPADGAPGDCTGLTNIAPVGTATLGAGLWGQLDMAGEAFEWTLDWYNGAYLDPCTDCAYVSEASYRVVRGGNFSSDATNLMPPYRLDNVPTGRASGIGVRCARTP